MANEIKLDMRNLNEIPDYVFTRVNTEKLDVSENNLTNIPFEISNLVNLVELKINLNPIRSLPFSLIVIPTLRKLIAGDTGLEQMPPLANLEELDLSGDPIHRQGLMGPSKSIPFTQLPINAVQCVNLRVLSLSGNHLSELPFEFVNFRNLESLDLSKNRFESIPHWFDQLANLRVLNVEENALVSFNANIPNLQKLLLGKNLITEIPYQLTSLQVLSLEENRIEHISENISNMVNLKTLGLPENRINSISERLTSLVNLEALFLNDNSLVTFPFDIRNMVRLEILDLSNNMIWDPVNIENTDVLTVYLDGNPFLEDEINRGDDPSDDDDDHNGHDNEDALLDDEDARAFYEENERLNQNDEDEDEDFALDRDALLGDDEDYPEVNNGIYGNTQNVHDSTVQRHFFRSVQNLLQDQTKEVIMENVFTLIDRENIESLRRYLRDPTPFSRAGDDNVIFSISYNDLFVRVWNRIQDHPNRDDILIRLNEELLESNGKCFVGRLTRLVNVLVGYYDDITIGISDTDRIGAIIQNVLNENRDRISQLQGGDPSRLQILQTEIRQTATDRLLSLGYTEENINIWINAIEI